MKVVLLIDDEPKMGDLVAMTLEDFDVKVIQVTNLAEALEAVSQQPPTLVLLDISLGQQEDGIAILPLIRQEPALSGSPVVIFSVHDSRRVEALEHGVEGFVAKPFEAQTLQSVLQPFLQ